jgi:hypothetical protein
MEAILAHGLGIGVALRLLPRQACILNPSAVSFIPGQGSQALEPVRGHGGEGVEGGPQGLGDEFQAVEHPDGGQHMGGGIVDEGHIHTVVAMARGPRPFHLKLWGSCSSILLKECCTAWMELRGLSHRITS